jgi:hypothetical protein
MAKSAEELIKQSGAKTFAQEQAQFSPGNRIPSQAALLAQAGRLSGLSTRAAIREIKRLQMEREKRLRAKAKKAAKAKARGGAGGKP